MNIFSPETKDAYTRFNRMLVRFVDINLQPEDEFIQFLSMSKGFQGGTFASFPKSYSPKNVIVLDVDFITALR